MPAGDDQEDSVFIELQPLGRRVRVPRGSALRDVLFPHGVEFPCGGQGRCKGCRVRVLHGELPVHDEERALLAAEKLREGWRLACRGTAQADLTLELAQWEARVLGDERTFSFTPREGLGIAIDLGTTTLVAQLLDLRSGAVLAVGSALNDQARHGADVMSRLAFELAQPGGMTRLIRAQLGGMVEELVAGREGGAREVVLVGNSAMHHFFGGLDVTPLAFDPFEPAQPQALVFTGAELGWSAVSAARVVFLPCMGGFVGSDLLAGVLATRLHESAEPAALVDLGTNGEIVVAHGGRVLCCSTAAGPAFEGARIARGMRAVTGAIAEVRVSGAELECRVLGQVAPRGLCGSGLVDAVAAFLDLGQIGPSGRMRGESLCIAGDVHLAARDVRELQLAKGAIAAGLEILVQRLGISTADLARVHLAGAFGNYIRLDSARRIGLLGVPLEKIQPAGNSALLGAKIALFAGTAGLEDLLASVEHVPLNEDPAFQDVYVENMAFPAA